MRKLLLIFFTLFLALPGVAQDVDVAVRPDVIYVEALTGNIVPMERVFFHIVIENKTKMPVDVDWIRFDVANSKGILFSGQYSGAALMDLFDSSIDRRRIETTAKRTLKIETGERKAISDVFMDFPKGFIGENLILELAYKSGGKGESKKTSVQLQRTQGFTGRLPFDGTWYVAAEHGYSDPHKRFLAEAFAYDFLQIGPNGKSYQRDGRSNADYYAYGKKVFAAKDGTVVSVRGDMAENVPGETTNVTTPGGNVVIIDHGNNQFGYYAHLKPFTVAVKQGARVKAGDVLGEVGNSGDSSEPHLHFHVMNNVDPSSADGIPVVFESWKAQAYSRAPVARQSGILPRGEFIQP
jgi:murein DD-endopeptidase MepM/ murein hydrolase activator NlpD